MKTPYIPKRFYKNASAALPYEWDWSRWLNKRNDSIATVEIITDAPLTYSNVSHTGGVVTAKLAGGVVDGKYYATCKITTVGNGVGGVLTNSRAIMILVTDF